MALTKRGQIFYMITNSNNSFSFIITSFFNITYSWNLFINSLYGFIKLMNLEIHIWFVLQKLLEFLRKNLEFWESGI